MPSLASDWLNPDPWLARARSAGKNDVRRALSAESPGIAEFASLLSEEAGKDPERLAENARLITRRRFGRTVSLYAPLYLSDFCENGCLYCGFAADRQRTRTRLEHNEAVMEMDAIQAMGFDEILLLTGDCTSRADFNYVRECVTSAAERFNPVTVEVFPMSETEYRALAESGCMGVTIYQETYDRDIYEKMHRWGPKRNFAFRLETPERALAAGMRNVGMGVLLGLADPIRDALALFQHVQILRKTYWRSGVSVSFPRVRPQLGGFNPPFPVDDAFLFQMICAWRICQNDLHLALSTREPPPLRDRLAGVWISKMSVASRTTVGGYHHESAEEGQFSVSDNRPIREFCEMLKSKGLAPVFKNWDAAFREKAP